MIYIVLCAAQLMGMLPFAPVAVDALSHSLPSIFPRCKKIDLGTDRCKDEVFDTSLHLIRNGVPELGLPPINPLEVPEIAVGESGGPVSLSVKFKNVVVTGLTNSSYFGSKFDFKNKNNISIIFKVTVDKVKFESDYEMSGRMLLVPLIGKGRCRLTYDIINATLGPMGKIVTIKGKEYFNVTDFYLEVHSIDKVDFHFDNLFNGDKNVGSPTLQLINENWQQLWGELLPVFVEVFRNLYVQLAKRVFDRVPFDEIFLD